MYAIYLLEVISSISRDYPFVFKGGTSILLHSKDLRRLSIDIDINMKESLYECKEKLLNRLKEIKGNFINVEPQIRNNKKEIKCLHYKFYYEPLYKTDEPYVLLDIVFQDFEFNYLKTKIIHPLLIQEKEIKNINLISIDDLLADKLTAFAPNTIGISNKSKMHTGRPKIVEIIKQIYDLSFLVDKHIDKNRVLTVYKAIASIQNKYNKNKHDYLECLEDTINTCELILSMGRSGNKEIWNLYVSYLTIFNYYISGDKLSTINLQQLIANIYVFTLSIKNLITRKSKISKVDYFLNRLNLNNKEQLEFQKLFNKEQYDELSKLLFI